jgi:hypothetical protein
MQASHKHSFSNIKNEKDLDQENYKMLNRLLGRYMVTEAIQYHDIQTSQRRVPEIPEVQAAEAKCEGLLYLIVLH